MRQSDYKYKYDNLRYNYNSLFIMQQRDGDYEDALQTLDELEKLLMRLNKDATPEERRSDRTRHTEDAIKRLGLKPTRRLSRS